MRISVIFRDLSLRTGGRRFIYEVTQRLLQRGYEVKIFTNKLNKQTCFKEILTLPYEVVFSRKQFMGRFKHILIWREFIKTGKKAAHWKPDIIFLQYAGESWFPPYFYDIGNSVGVAYLHRIPLLKKDSGNLLKKTYKLIINHWKRVSLENLKLIMVNSKYVAKGLQKTGLVSPSIPIEIVPLGVDNTKFHPTYEDGGFLLSLSRIHPQKNLELLIHTMKMVKSNIPLIIAGSVQDKLYRDKLLSLIKKLNLTKNVTIRTTLTDDEIIHLLQKCSLFLFPSIEDTFGIVVLEAMSCGKPVIACNFGGVPEVIGNAGYLVNTDPKNWANIIDMLLTDSELRKEASIKALQRSKLFSWDKTLNNLIKTFEQLI